MIGIPAVNAFMVGRGRSGSAAWRVRASVRREQGQDEYLAYYIGQIYEQTVDERRQRPKDARGRDDADGGTDEPRLPSLKTMEKECRDKALAAYLHAVDDK